MAAECKKVLQDFSFTVVLSEYVNKIGCDIVGAGSPLGCAGNIATNFVAIFIISVTKICAILPNIATKDQKKSFVASGGNIAKIFVTLMTDVGVYVGDK